MMKTPIAVLGIDLGKNRSDGWIATFEGNYPLALFASLMLSCPLER